MRDSRNNKTIGTNKTTPAKQGAATSTFFNARGVVKKRITTGGRVEGAERVAKER